MSEEQKRGEELFDALNRNKKLQRRRLLRTVLAVIAVIGAILMGIVLTLRQRVEERFASALAEVQSYSAQRGTIHTLVSGSGTLAEVDREELTVPAGVTITDCDAEAGELVSAGDLLAQVDMATVMSALSDLQDQLDDKDRDLASAKGEKVSSYISAGVNGRVKQIFAQPEMDVTACMAEHGALAILSIDGHMAVDVETDALEKGAEVRVLRPGGTELLGSVKSAAGGKATVLVTDNGPRIDEEVTLVDEKGEIIAKGSLYIHNPLAVTGYAGTISSVAVKENSQVSAWSTLFNLKNTSFSANYDALLRERAELEETLLALLTIYRDGAVLAPMDGMISSVEYDGDLPQDDTADTALLTLYPGREMSVTIGIDEADILALEEGQEAQIEVGSVSDELFTGTVTEINKVADTSTGVTQYSAEVTLPKGAGMLSGMTANVDIKIQGVEDALIIPVDALHQTRDTWFVYTGYDSETQHYGDMREVTVGMQNDEFAEIRSGLKEGETVWYTKQEDFFFMFGGMGGGMSGMSGMSGGGNRGGSGMPNMGGQRPGG